MATATRIDKRVPAAAAPVLDDGTGAVPLCPDAERQVLGALMYENTSQAEELATARSILQPEDFHNPAHRAVFAAISALIDRQEPVDILTVGNELERAGNLTKAGGRTAVSALRANVFTNANLKSHARIVFEHAARRKIIEGCGEISEKCRNAPGDLSDLLDGAHALFGQISARETTACRSAQDVMLEALAQMDDFKTNRDRPNLPWGYPTLDALTGGLRAGDCNIIAGSPGIGKTSLALNVALKLAKRGIPVGIFSLEMTDTELGHALICIDAGVDGLVLVRGALSAVDYDRACESGARIADLPLHFDQQRDLSIHQLRARTQRLVRAHGVKVVILDYLQLMRPPKVETREQQVAAMSRACKLTALESGVCMLVLSQLSRESRKQAREPDLHDLRDSGSIEQDADTVLFVHRPSRIDRAARRDEAVLLLKKQRKGPEDERIMCRYTAAHRRFEEVRK